MKHQNKSRVSMLAWNYLMLLTGLLLSVQTSWAETHEIAMTAVETEVVIDGSGERYKAWTFNGQFPGPVVRVAEGDTVKFTLTNPATNKNPHAMDFHAAEFDFLPPMNLSAIPLWPRSPACSSTIAGRQQ